MLKGRLSGFWERIKSNSLLLLIGLLAGVIISFLDIRRFIDIPIVTVTGSVFILYFAVLRIALDNSYQCGLPWDSRVILSQHIANLQRHIYVFVALVTIGLGLFLIPEHVTWPKALEYFLLGVLLGVIFKLLYSIFQAMCKLLYWIENESTNDDQFDYRTTKRAEYLLALPVQETPWVWGDDMWQGTRNLPNSNVSALIVLLGKHLGRLVEDEQEDIAIKIIDTFTNNLDKINLGDSLIQHTIIKLAVEFWDSSLDIGSSVVYGPSSSGSMHTNRLLALVSDASMKDYDMAGFFFKAIKYYIDKNKPKRTPVLLRHIAWSTMSAIQHDGSRTDYIRAVFPEEWKIQKKTLCSRIQSKYTKACLKSYINWAVDDMTLRMAQQKECVYSRAHTNVFSTLFPQADSVLWGTLLSLNLLVVLEEKDEDVSATHIVQYFIENEHKFILRPRRLLAISLAGKDKDAGNLTSQQKEVIHIIKNSNTLQKVANPEFIDSCISAINKLHWSEKYPQYRSAAKSLLSTLKAVRCDLR